MYNFDLEKNEKVDCIFDDVLVRQNDIQKVITIALTNKRLLFLDFCPQEPHETLRVTSATNYVRIKEVFYYINLDQIKSINKYSLLLNNGKCIEFDDINLYKALKGLK